MDSFEQIKRDNLQPIYFEAGAGLFDCQTFEYGIGYLLYLLSRLGVEGLSPERTSAILDDDEKKTAGQLIGLLKKHAEVSQDLEKELSDALRARNKLIHRYLIDNVERFVDASERELIVKEIRELRGKVRGVQKSLEPFIAGLVSIVDGLNLEEFSNEAKEQFMHSVQSA
ncbi:hypothetical protein [Photobacterium kishitanii]|uniref:hypothetical protein n=1 Tax=Photobacterium kishitanii TaxID=318456 RepID=UPI0007F919BF|nr:hypothetical protein [Photobacterium kishitanii]OBU30678.1 hypothetical protein AYY23_04785 [Photobacterium kishitanii]PSW47457.1 hypothetical protein C0W66_17910 [Photobacterium kishitanii]